ncbi:MAG: transporter substrate-binding domain-containing protein [Acidaminococcaceae bacterium]|jgi:signal transduction histidine kinase/ABC-type amino acid transport substrate-binding protein/CheY-like chemotaxis protein|nr:transporter substrate-binding domain-containing protein [Acidaminococcaceae bacterium]
MRSLLSLLKQKLFCLLTLGLALCLFLFAAAAAAENAKTVRVGWYIVPGLQELLPDGSHSGYNYEYLAKIKQYTNWQYDFVYGTWSELQAKLVRGDIDLIGDVARTPARLQMYDYCDLPNGFSRMIMACRKDDNRFGYNDYQAFDGIKVGTVPSTFRRYLLDREAAKHHFKVTYQEYSTEAEMFAALDRGETDVAIFSNVTSYPDYKVLSEWEPNPFYFVVNKKRPDVLADLNAAMRKVQATDLFMQERLFKKYFKKNTAGTVTAFSRPELDYLQSKPKIKVLAYIHDKPVAYEEQDQLQGIAVDYLQALTAKTGLSLEYIYCQSRQELLDRLSKGEGDVALQMPDDFLNGQQFNAIVTQPYLNLRFGLISRGRQVETIKLVAVQKGYQLLKKKLLERQLQIQEYPDAEACLQAVLEGQADAAVLDNVTYEQMVYHAKYQGLVFNTLPTLEYGLCLGVSDKSPRVLFSILEKAAADMSAATLGDIIVKNTAVQYHYTLHDYFMYGAPMFLIIIVLLGVVIAAIFWFRRKDQYEQKLLAAKEQSDRAKLAAERANESKSTFLSNMSHDLRTPLNGIIGYTELALQEQGPEQKQDYLQKVKTSGNLLLDLVNDTLDLSRIESGKLTLKPEVVDGCKYWEEIVTAMMPSADVKQVSLRTDFSKYPRQMIRVDRIQVKKVLLNLLSNAIKYTPAGGTVDVSVTALQPPEHGCTRRIIVADTGIGMSKEFMEKMFEPFSQEHRSESGNITGTGLGLSIVKRIVDIMGGTITVESEIYKGTKFTVDLPLECWDKTPEEATAQAADQKQLEQQVLAGMQVLLCEDNYLNAEIAQLLLKNKKMQVDWAHNGLEGVEKFQQSAPNYYQLILMDMRMPVLGGLEATKTIRGLQRPDAKTIPIVAMTAEAFEETIQEAKDAGMNGYITKPIAPDLFFKTLAKLLSKK